ncbi:MAG: DUF502 domain-containing protein [Bacteroidetes bacterium]|nr:DUF502 domain-containing protein [Bacteroidota bacterium]MBS1630501.1 DUF502 domain-containing protein [Bacteroidota bacterium]
MRDNIAALLLRSFLKGLIILAPIAITAYVIWLVFYKVDTLIPMVPRGLGFVIIISSVTVIGYFGTRFFIGKAIFDFFDHVLERTPGIKFIYSSVKDIMSSFVGDKKRFTQPVWVRTHNTPDTWRLGFLTQEDMGYLGMEGHVAVYLPHAYAISGWVVVTASTNIRHVTTMSPAEAMKFAVSGGITISDENGPKTSKDRS